jgi:diguanylate cyclase (GGDEF)-like protein
MIGSEDHHRHRRPPCTRPPAQPPAQPPAPTTGATSFQLRAAIPLLLALCAWSSLTAAASTPEQWLKTYRALADQAAAACAPVALPSIPAATPSRAFPFPRLAGTNKATATVIYSRDTVAERLIVLAEDARGCVHAGLSGRAVAFDARDITALLPNTLIPAALGPTPPVAIVADHKSIRPWVDAMSEPAFRDMTARTWIGFGAYTGILAVLLLVGISLTLWLRSRLALAYSLYICILQLFQLQSFGLGFAWLPFWPGPEHARLMQALAMASIVPGIAMMVLAFLRPERTTRRLIIGAVALCALAFLTSAWSNRGYGIGAAMVALLTVSVMVLLVRQLRGAHAPAMRWFAAGLLASMLGGGIQALTVLPLGAALPDSAASAFLLGTLAESLCWMIALAMSLRADRLSMDAKLAHEASHDPLTGLCNRTSLYRQMDDALNQVRLQIARSFAVLFLDLDNFKQINDSLGHSLGDQALVAAARALEELQLPSDAIGRLDGDAFLILLRLGTQRSVAEGAATSIVARFREPLAAQGRMILSGASIGVVIVTDKYDDIDSIIQDADTALLRAKRAGGGQQVLFETHMRREAQRRARMRSELITALGARQLMLYYQPVVEFASSRSVGFEALLRWRHPQYGVQSAAEFLPTAERCGLLPQLSAQVIDQTLQQVSDWQRAGRWRRGEYLSINVSTQQLADERLFDQLDRAFEHYPVDPGSIRIDLPESALSQQPELVRKALPRLLGRNLLVAVDDFGSGLSSLTMLADFAFDMIKLDASVVEGIAHRERSQRLAHSVMRLAEELGCLVSAEGIETAAQYSLLESMGYRYGQGKLLGAPMPASEVSQWIDQWRPEQWPPEPSIDGDSDLLPKPVLH